MQIVVRADIGQDDAGNAESVAAPEEGAAKPEPEVKEPTAEIKPEIPVVAP